MSRVIDTATRKRDRYLDLVARFPLRPIRTKTQHREARAVIDRLAVRGDGLDHDERDYLHVLSDLVDAYERERHAMPVNRGTPIQKLKYLLEASEKTPGQLERILDLSQTAVSLMLSGKRGLSKQSISKLAAHFHLSADYFL